MKFFNLLIIFTIVSTGWTVYAEEKKAWSGSGEIGYLMTTGNSETESVNARAGLKHEGSCVLAGVNLAAVYSSEETEIDGRKKNRTSAEKYNAQAKVGYRFRPVDYIFINAAYEDDRFSGYDYRSDYSAGYGRKLFNTDTVKLEIELGPGYRYDRLDDGKTESETVFRGHLLFAYRFSKQAAFQQEATLLAGPDNTGTKAVTSLKAQIVGTLSMKVSYTVDHNSHVPQDKSHTDTETALTLVYDF